jgi:nucleoside diphosphate kinase
MPDPRKQDRISVLLVKPDGVRDPAKSRAIAESIDASTLKIRERRDVSFSVGDADFIWPKFASPAHAFTRRMLARYITSGPCQVLVVESADVIAVCQAVRSRVRVRFGAAAFENALHTPADQEERAANLEFLTTAGRSSGRHSDPSTGPGRFGRFGDLADAEVSLLADRLWEQRVLHGWEFCRSSCENSGREGLVLLPGSDNSIDFEISAIAEIFPRHEIEWSASRLLEAEKFGSSHIAVESSTAVPVLAKLRALGVRAEITAASGSQR